MSNLKSQISNLQSRIEPALSHLQFPILAWTMTTLMMMAFAIRVYHLGVSDLTFDESASAFISAKPYREMIQYLLGAFQELGPGYYTPLRAWEFFAGRSEFALRYFSLIFGVLGVALIYRLGRRGLGTGAGVIAALLLTLQPFHAYYSQDARMYSLMPVEAMLMIYLFDRLCHEHKLHWWLAFGAVSGVAVLTHYFMGFMLAALFVYLLLHARSHWRTLLPWLGGLVVAAAATLAWIFTSRASHQVERVLGGISWQVFLERLTPAQGMLRDIAFGVQWRPPPEWWMAIVTLVVAGVLVSLFGLRWRTLRPGGAWLLPAWLIVPPLLLTIVPWPLEARYNAAIVPAYCLLLALVVTWFWDWGIRTRLLAPLILGLLVYMQVTPLIPTMNVVKSDYGHVIAYLRNHARPGDALVLNGDWQWVQLKYYPAPEILAANTYWLPGQTPPGLDPRQAQPQLEKALAESKRIWVLPTAVEQADPKRFVAGWLNEHAYITPSYKDLTLYTVRDSSAAFTPLDPPVSWDDAIALESVRLTQNQTVPGEPLLLDLNWQVLRAPQGGRSVWLELADRDGGVWQSSELVLGEFFAPSDQWQVNQRIILRAGLLIPPGTPPGEFDVRVNVVGSSPSTGGDYVTIASVKVLPCSDMTPCSPPLEGDDLTPLRAAFDNGLTLAGYQPGGLEFFQGKYASITFYWRSARTLTDDVKERLALVDRSGRVIAQTEASPVAAWFPSSRWMPGQWLADPQAIPIPAKAPQGDYVFRVRLVTSDGRTLPVTTGGASRDYLDVGHIRISERPRQWHAGPISHPLKVEFGDKIRLLGYDIQVNKPAGQSEVALTLYWQAMREMDEYYTVFTHVVGADGTPVGQKDSWPRGGDYPTNLWKRGEVIKDEYLIPLAVDAEPGAYRVELGLYVRATGERLAAVADGAQLKDNIVIVPVNVEP
jgi:4-amino-4-deoxy-L-arabinose transferase-like glycosyltransferase